MQLQYITTYAAVIIFQMKSPQVNQIPFDNSINFRPNITLYYDPKYNIRHIYQIHTVLSIMITEVYETNLKFRFRSDYL